MKKKKIIKKISSIIDACKLIICLCYEHAKKDDAMKEFVNNIISLKEHLESFRYTSPYIFKDVTMLEIIQTDIDAWQKAKTINEDQETLKTLIIESLKEIFEFLNDHMQAETKME